jgi:phosphate transport system permease protein
MTWPATACRAGETRAHRLERGRDAAAPPAAAIRPERRFRWIGLGAILLSAAFLAFLLISMTARTAASAGPKFGRHRLPQETALPRSARSRARRRGCRASRRGHRQSFRTPPAQYGRRRSGSSTRWLRCARRSRSDPSILSRKAPSGCPHPPDRRSGRTDAPRRSALRTSLEAAMR